jgi:hypothetical protein
MDRLPKRQKSKEEVAVPWSVFLPSSQKAEEARERETGKG